jgi:predicted nucleotidyltransferase
MDVIGEAGHGTALQNRILSTLRFFDLQDVPLTLFELHKFLVNDTAEIKKNINTDYEYIGKEAQNYEQVKISDILLCLNEQLKTQVESKKGYYCLVNRTNIIETRINNYFYGFFREKRIKKYLWFLKYIPFVRGVAILGSQALGQPKPNSDIDLFIVTDSEFLGLGRALATAYFQVLGLRRHGKYISNRFCLNHYLAGVRALPGDRNLYTAMEYLKLRPVFGFRIWQDFQNNNNWVSLFFPHAKKPPIELAESQAFLQRVLEKILRNSFGRKLEEKIKSAQLGRIQRGEFIVADETEMSFHPNNRKSQLFSAFFEN